MAEDEEEEEEWRPSLLPWKARFADDYVLRIGPARVAVAQAPSTGRSGEDDPGVTGCCVWDGAVVLAKHLCRAEAWSLLAQRLGGPPGLVLELGAGTGLLGMALHSSGLLPPAARLLLTDLPGALPLLRANAGRGPPCRPPPEVAPLRWGDAASTAAALRGARPDLLLGADLCYRMPNVEPLLAALRCLRPGGAALLGLDRSHCPEAVAAFRAGARARGFRERLPPPAEQHPRCRCEEVLLLELWAPGEAG